MKFSCPQCQQHIECGSEYAGMKISCPACQGELVVPSGPATAAAGPASSHGPAPHGSGPRLSVSLAPHRQPAAPPSAQRSAVSRPIRPKARFTASEGKVKSILVTVAVVVGLVIGLVLVLPKLNRNRAQSGEETQEEPGVIGRQLGHIGELNTVMDATEDLASGGGPERGRRSSAQGWTFPSGETLPVVPPSWTMDLSAASIPKSQVNGSLFGSEFVVESTSLLTSERTPMLSLRQGGADGPYREVLLLFGLQAGNSLEGQTWTVTDQDPPGEVRVAVRWKEGGNLRQELFSGGYALKLELGQTTEGVLPGRLFLSLPDDKKSVVAGLFQATVRAAKAAGRASTSLDRGGPGTGRGSGVQGGSGAGAAPRRGPAEVILKQRARELGGERGGADPNPQP